MKCNKFPAIIMSSSDKISQTLIRKRKLETDIGQIEQKIYDLETSYLEETAGYNVARGWKGFHKVPVPVKKLEGTTIPYSDHVFSLSSNTSPLGVIYPWVEALHSSKELAKLIYSSTSSSLSTSSSNNNKKIKTNATSTTNTIKESTSTTTISNKKETTNTTTPVKSTPKKNTNTITPSKSTPLITSSTKSTTKKIPPSSSKKK